jgi:nucleoid DNA-binding protein
MPGDPETLTIPPRWALKFKASSSLKEDLDAMKKGGKK